MKRQELVEEFAEELRGTRARLADELAVLVRAKELSSRLAARKDEWLTPAMCRPDVEQGFGIHVLHEEADHSLAVFVVSWLPQRGTPPHDHGTWAVVVGLDGSERNRMWRRLDDRTRPGYAELQQVTDTAVGAGDIVTMPAGSIHSVWNDGASMSVSLHVYGMHVNHTDRSQFDPERRTETIYKVRVNEPSTS